MGAEPVTGTKGTERRKPRYTRFLWNGGTWTWRRAVTRGSYTDPVGARCSRVGFRRLSSSDTSDWRFLFDQHTSRVIVHTSCRSMWSERFGYHQRNNDIIGVTCRLSRSAPD